MVDQLPFFISHTHSTHLQFTSQMVPLKPSNLVHHTNKVSSTPIMVCEHCNLFAMTIHLRICRYNMETQLPTMMVKMKMWVWFITFIKPHTTASSIYILLHSIVKLASYQLLNAMDGYTNEFSLMTTMTITCLLQIISNKHHVHLSHVPPPSNLVKSICTQMISTVRLRKSFTRLTRSTRNQVNPRHMIMITWKKRLCSRQPPSTAAFWVLKIGSQSLLSKLDLLNWHGR